MPDDPVATDAADETTEAVSPSATGGAGTTFEHKVGAACLATLLTGGQPFFLEAASLREVHLQAGHQGWNTDDIALTAVARDGSVRKALIQVKRALIVSEKNTEFSETIKKAFDDFRQTERFDPTRDIVGIITSSLAAKHARALSNLFDCARASLNAVDFLKRLLLPGYLGKPTADEFEVIKSILAQVERCPDIEEVLRFLRCLRITDIDLNQGEGILESSVKSLLAVTCSGPGDAIDTWHQLRSIASDSSGKAVSFTRETLPEELQRRHARFTGYSDGITALLEASEVVANGVFSDLSPGVIVPRIELHTALMAKIESSRLLMITGNAGAGKSAAAKALFLTMRQDGIGFAFRASDLTGNHIDRVLHVYHINLKGIGDQTSAHQRKILWIESIEQLWEKSSQERLAFYDLLQKLGADKTWRIILTSREYSSDLVADGIREKLGMSPATVAVENFSEEELAVVAKALPQLTPLLENPKLKSVVGNAFNLKLATQLRWSPEDAAPSHIRGFREKVWKDVVCKVSEPADEAPARRRRAVEEVALRRARALTPFIDASALDSTILRRLVQDGILYRKDSVSDYHAPAHDVFEDWALMLRLQRKFTAEYEEDLTLLVAHLEEYPAMRRAYRKWLIEELDQNQGLEPQVIAFLAQDRIASHWRDDTLVAVLLSELGDGFLMRNIALLRANSAKLLRQAIHLLRVAGKVDIPLRKFGVEEGGDISLPGMRGWAGAAYAMHAARDDFTLNDQSFVISFIEDWIGLTRYGRAFSYPPGAEQIAQIILHEIARTPDCHANEENRETLFRLLISIPLAGKEELLALVEKSIHKDSRRRDNELLLKSGFCHFENSALVRDMPELVLRITEDKLGLNRPLNEDVNQRDGYSMDEISYAFGMGSRDLDEYEASAYAGPFLRMLQWHPNHGLTLVTRFINRCCEAYAHADNRYKHIEPPTKVRLKLADGTELEQIGNQRLWFAYRSFSVTPYVFQSALMALEHWLLEESKKQDFDLESVLLRLLMDGNNVAVTAVVASLATAYPERAGEAALTLLSSWELIMVDISRMAREQSHIHAAFGYLRQGRERLMVEERKASATLRHRSSDLREVARALQMRDKFKARIEALLDVYKAELSPEGESDEGEIKWRLQLANMDLRTHVPVRGNDGDIYLIPGAHTPEVQAYIEKKKPAIDQSFSRIGRLVHWQKAFDGKLDTLPNEAELRALLDATVALLPPEIDDSEDGHISRMINETRVFAAATCIRDYWSWMTISQREWCALTVIDTLDQCFQRGRIAFLDGGPLSGVPQSASVLFALVGKDLPDEIRSRITPVIADVITADDFDIQASAAHGVAAYLWNSDRNLALSCIHSVMTYSEELYARRNMGHQQGHGFVIDPEDTWFVFLSKAKDRAQTRIIANEHPGEAILASLDWLTSKYRTAATQIIGMVSGSFADAFVRSAVLNIIKTIPTHWGRRHFARTVHDEDDDHADIKYQLMQQCVDLICHFILQLSPAEIPAIMLKLSAEIVENPEAGDDLVKWLVLHQGDKVPADSFWIAWASIAEAFIEREVSRRNRPHGTESLMREIFLGRNWRDTREWLPIRGHEHRVRTFFERLSTSQNSIENYTYYLNTIGTPTLPDGLECLATKLADDGAIRLLTPNAVYYLESILVRLWGNSDFSMRATAARRTMILLLLDQLIACGSSKAFRLRDDFLTPYAA